MEIKQLINDVRVKFDHFCQNHLPAKDVLKEKTSAVAKIALALVAAAFVGFCVVSAAPLLFKAVLFGIAAIAAVALYKHLTGSDNPFKDVKTFAMDVKTKIENFA